MADRDVRVEVAGGHLAGWVRGDGVPVLLLHGGPGLPFGYLAGVAADLGPGYRVAAFQQRGLAPSTTDGPYDVATHLADVEAMLGVLGSAPSDRPYVIGHSWGGHLALHVAVALSDRVSGVLCVDPLGGVGDGGLAKFEAEMMRRTPAESRARAEQLDHQAVEGGGTDADALESLHLVWRAYFADWTVEPALAPPTSLSVPAYAGGFASLVARLPELEAALPHVTVPLGVVAGAQSPMPVEESARATAARVPGGWLEVVEGAGHFPWVERPGCVRAGLERLVAG